MAMTEQELAVITFIVNNREANKKMEETYKIFNKTMDALNKKMVKSKQIEPVSFEEYKKALLNVKKIQTQQAKEKQKDERKALAAAKAIAREEKNVQRQRTADLMSFGFSALFTAMAVKRALMDLAKSSMTSYNKLTANTDLANNATNRLGMAMDYLRYTVGSALSAAFEALMPVILPIIDSLTDWIERNEELAGNLIVWGIVLFSIIGILGQFALAILMIMPAHRLLTGLSFTPWITKLLTAFGIGEAGILAFKNALGKVVAIGLTLIASIIAFKFLKGAFKESNVKDLVLGALATGFALDIVSKALGVKGKIGTLSAVAAVFITLSFGLSKIAMNKVNEGKTGEAIANEFGSIFNGIAAGAAIGTMIAPGAGTAIGGAIGGIVAEISILVQLLGEVDFQNFVVKVIGEFLNLMTKLGQVFTKVYNWITGWMNKIANAFGFKKEIPKLEIPQEVIDAAEQTVEKTRKFSLFKKKKETEGETEKEVTKQAENQPVEIKYDKAKIKIPEGEIPYTESDLNNLFDMTDTGDEIIYTAKNTSKSLENTSKGLNIFRDDIFDFIPNLKNMRDNTKNTTETLDPLNNKLDQTCETVDTLNTNLSDTNEDLELWKKQTQPFVDAFGNYIANGSTESFDQLMPSTETIETIDTNLFNFQDILGTNTETISSTLTTLNTSLETSLNTLISTIDTGNTNISTSMTSINTTLTDAQTNADNTKILFGKLSDKEMETKVNTIRNNFTNVGSYAGTLATAINKAINKINRSNVLRAPTILK